MFDQLPWENRYERAMEEKASRASARRPLGSSPAVAATADHAVHIGDNGDGSDGSDGDDVDDDDEDDNDDDDDDDDVLAFSSNLS